LALSDFIGKFSGPGLWDRWLKIMAGMQGAREIAERVARYEKLTDLERNTLASLEIGPPEAEPQPLLISSAGTAPRKDARPRRISATQSTGT